MKKKLNFLTFSLYLITIAICFAFGFIYYFNKKLGPALIECAEDEVKRLTTLVMNNCIKKYLDSSNTTENILQIERNNEGEIERIQYNTKVINQTTTLIIEMLETDLEYMVKGNFAPINLKLNSITDEYYEKINDGILFTISIGSATGNSFLANIGPKIPINLKLVGDVQAKVSTKITEYGMNNALVEIFINVKATTVIHMPFLSKKVTVKNTIPLTMEILQGSILRYYIGSDLESSLKSPFNISP